MYPSRVTGKLPENAAAQALMSKEWWYDDSEMVRICNRGIMNVTGDVPDNVLGTTY
jgi:hypothetical protein